jgi:hypothetical protein
VRYISRIALAAAGLSVVLGGSPALADTRHDLAHLRALATKYHDVRAAIADGYVATDMCVPGMGYHYANTKYVADGVIDPWKPEVVLYVPTAHGPKLAGVEYMKVDADQNLKTDRDRPTVFGERFEGPMLGHEPGQPIHYDKHVWLWKHNPKGTFAQMNPKVHC